MRCPIVQLHLMSVQNAIIRIESRRVILYSSPGVVSRHLLRLRRPPRPPLPVHVHRLAFPGQLDVDQGGQGSSDRFNTNFSANVRSQPLVLAVQVYRAGAQDAPQEMEGKQATAELLA